MEQYINKDALVAEIERLREQDYPCDTFEESTGYYNGLDEISTFIDTLKVKEVDLEEEIERVRKTHFINDDFEKATLEGRQITNIAKHFFELGLKVQKGE